MCLCDNISNRVVDGSDLDEEIKWIRVDWNTCSISRYFTGIVVNIVNVLNGTVIEVI
jgi:hypothetical protein